MRIGSIVLVIWLAIGLLAAWQRDYFSGDDTNCAETSTILLNVVAGPLNYLGVDPEVKKCDVPEPSE